MSIEDLEVQVDSLESAIANLNERVDELESVTEQTDYAVDDMNSDFVIFRAKSAGEIQNIKKVLALATSPDPDDLDKYTQLREAFDKYQFVKKLVLGDGKDLSED